MRQLKRRTATLVVLLLLGGSVPVPAQSPRPSDPELAAGIALVREGDFENAVLKLDTVVRRLLAAPGPHRDAAQAYVYLGVAFLELNQELVARGKFQLAQALDPQLRLDPGQFSPEQIRVFESARAETAARPAATASAAPTPRPRTSPSPAAPGAVAGNEEQKKKKKKSPLLWILAGAAVIGGGAAAAGGGGGGGGQPPTTTPVGNTTSTTAVTQAPDTTTTTTTPPGGEPPTSTTTTTTTTPPGTPTTTTPPTTTPTSTTTTTTVPVTTTTTLPATTTTTTTTLPVGCSTASVGPPDQAAYGSLGSGSCPVSAAASCNWSAAVVGNPNWVTLTTASGTGSGQIRFNLGLYVAGPARQATIFLVQNTSASCTIIQTATLLTDDQQRAESLTWTSDLDLAGGQGQIVLDGSSAAFQSRGTHSGWMDATPGLHRIEATVVSADGKPGTWRFRLAGPLRPGSLRVIAGALVTAGADAIVFRLAGTPGERVLFSFRLH